MPSRPRQPRARLLGSAPQAALATSISVALGLLMSFSPARGADILRRGTGGSSGSGKSETPAAGATDASVALQATARAQAALARTTNAVQAVKAAQDAARAAARISTPTSGFGLKLAPVPNGLAPGGLEVDPGVKYDPSLWQGAKQPVQVQTPQFAVTITQTQQQAVLNWKTFNVGGATTVTFDQSQGGTSQSKWVAINKINDPSGQPSQILGSIRAPGHVYLINRNGILFGGTAELNLHGLVASSLPINDNLLQSGLLENPKQEFLFSALPTDLFKPKISDPAVAITVAAPSYRVSQVLAQDAVPVVRAVPDNTAPKTLVANTDYTTTLGADAHTTVTLTPAGLAKIGSAKVDVTYTPVVVKSGPVVVEPGAKIISPSTAQHVGGRVSLVGPTVRNEGTISTPDGQTIMAAGLQVGFTAHPTKDPSLRGLDTYVGAITVPAPTAPAPGDPVITDTAPPAGTVTNTGFIDSPRANTTLAGQHVQQLGVIRSSTSVSLNGRIDLLADYDAVGNSAYDSTSANSGLPFLSRASGSVELGPQSATFILPELRSEETVAGTALPLKSQINLRGRTIHLGQNASLIAPSADISLNAGNWSYVGGAQPQSKFVFTGGQIYLDPGALVSAAGSLNIPVELAQNLLNLQLRGPELADSPLQRGGLFRQMAIDVDLRRTGTYNGMEWVGTPLGDLWGYLGLIQRTVGELTTAGGNVTMNAGSSVVLQKGASIDVSGGWVSYQSGLVKTSRVEYAGHLFDIADAPPDRVFTGFFDGKFTVSQAKFGLTKTFSHPLVPSGEHWEEGYRQGAAGGSIAITSPAMALDGTLLGQTLAGPRQQSDAPKASSLKLVFQAQRPLAQNEFVPFSPTPPHITFGSIPDQPAVDAFRVDAAGDPDPLSDERRKRVVLAPGLLDEGGFGNLAVENNDGTITVAQEVRLTGPARGSLSFKAANVELLGAIRLPAGSVNVVASNFSPFRIGGLLATPAVDATRGSVTLGAQASIDTSGLLVDERQDLTGPFSLRRAPEGGSIDLRGFHVALAPGSTLDVSGGVTVSPLGKRTYGNAGSINIQGGSDPNLAAVIGGSLELGAKLQGYSGARGGTLAIQAPRIAIGGSAGDAGALQLAPGFFSQGGFATFSLTGLGAKGTAAGQYFPAISIAPGTIIEPVVESYLAVTSGSGVELRHITLPVGMRPAVSLSFTAKGVRDNFLAQPLVARGDFILGAGAEIRAGVLGSVSITGDSAAILGRIDAPAGSISITGAVNSLPLFAGTSDAVATVHLGPQASLSVAGTTVYTADRFGRHTGSVLPGGTISVRGNIVAESGARLDVSGTTAQLEMSSAQAAILDRAAGSPVVPASSGVGSPLFAAQGVTRTVDSNAGTISLAGGQELFVDATLLGRAGGPGALGGTLLVSSGRLNTVGHDQTPLDPTLSVTQDGLTIGTIAHDAAGSAIGQRVRTASGGVASQLGHFAVASFSAGGFDALTLGGTVEFKGPINLAARRELHIADGGVILTSSTVRLAAPYVSLGQAFQAPLLAAQQTSPFVTGGGAPYTFAATSGAGVLNVTAQLIDIGNLSLQGIGRVNLKAAGGDIRGDGTFQMAGALTVHAGQIYPTTASTFTIAVDGSVLIEAGGQRALPWSAGGTLSIYAKTIDQRGVLRAPVGTINLGWDGTGTAPVNAISGGSVAVAQQVTLAAGSQTSVSMIDPGTGRALTLPYGLNPLGSAWVDPSGKDISAGGVPAKTVHIAGLNIAQQAGSVIDVRGGGDLYAYRFQSGNGGSADLLGTPSAPWVASGTYQAGALVSYGGQTYSARRETTGQVPSSANPAWRLVPQSFAVVPGYASDFVPYAPFNATSDPSNLAAGDPGYVSTGLRAGDRVYLAANGTLAAGEYTLLPARYALLPGAVLVTPTAGVAYGGITLEDGARLVPGYRFNALAGSSAQPLVTQFEVVSGDVLRSRAQYGDFSANKYLKELAFNAEAKIPRLPLDAGYVSFSAVSGLKLNGSIATLAAIDGRGATIDISTVADLTVTANGAANGHTGIILSAATLNSFGADSLLLGGVRTSTAAGTVVKTNTTRLTLDNGPLALSGPEIILVAKDALTLAPGAHLRSIVGGSRSDAGAPLLLGTAGQDDSGDGALLRVSQAAPATVIRRGIGMDNSPLLAIGAGADISGTSVTLDSSARTSLDTTATIHAKFLALNSGRITMALDNPGALPPDPGLLLSGPLLQSIQGARSLSLLSYTTFDIYGTGNFTLAGGGTLALHAAEIRGFNNPGPVNFYAGDILLDNAPGLGGSGTLPGAATGTLALHAGTIRIGANTVQVNQYANLELDATQGVILQETGGLKTQGALHIHTPLLTGSATADQTIIAGGALKLDAPTGASAVAAGAIGAQVKLIGASIVQNTRIVLPAGTLTLRATTDNVTVGGLIDVSGRSQDFFDLTRYINAGSLTLTADAGNVSLDPTSVIDLSAAPGGGHAGSLSIAAPKGTFTLQAGSTLWAQGGGPGRNGTFSLDVKTLPSTAAIGAALTAGHFTETQSYRIRQGDVLVDGAMLAHTFNLSVDQGSITVTADGSIDASGLTGGAINLMANGSVTLLGGADLTVAGEQFDAAGKGGAISLEAGSQRNGVANTAGFVDLRTDSHLDLSVTAKNAGSAALGQFSGTLHLRAPQTTSSTDLQVAAINGTILGASEIVVEGYKLITPAGGTINATVQNTVRTNATTFVGAPNTTTSSYTLMRNRLLANNAGLSSIVSIQAGAELINLTGNLTLSANWDLSTFRFGPDNAPGILTMRANGNLIFTHRMSLSDGFGGASAFGLWDAPLLAAGSRSWSYRLTAGADFSAADFHAVQSLDGLGLTTGSLLLGNGAPALPTATSNTRSTTIPNFYQTIRTGTGSIDISAARDVQILNPLATIYTAGTRAAALGNFDQPVLFVGSGTQNPIFAASYSLGGGNVSIHAQNNIGHYIVTGSGATAKLNADSTREMPTNWLYRRGAVDPATGQFATLSSGEVASTSWWIDFSNFFEGVGALGGGNVTLTAGNDISNVDAVAPTNARMPKTSTAAAGLLELGGGNVTITAGRDIDGGTYYVERGAGALLAGGSIHTNATRAAVARGQLAAQSTNQTTWLPTTLFLGEGSFDVSARGDVLLGSVANPFLLPQGINNTTQQRTYFSTYAPESAVGVSSLRGDVTLRDQASGGVGSLYAWYQNVLFLDTGTNTFSVSQPWLRLAESTPGAFLTSAGLMAPTLSATAFAGDVNLVGTLRLAPAARGTLELAAAGSINGVQVNTADIAAGLQVWGSSALNLSDADPNRIPGISSPLSYFGLAGNTTAGTLLTNFNALFAETGATLGATNESKQALHGPGPLHLDDPQPVRLYAADGNISGLTLFSGKRARIIAGRDLTDLALYVQNASEDDFTIVSAGRDLVAYAPNSPLRQLAQAPGQQLANFVPDISIPASGSPTAGDLQIAGPGTLEVLAGRNVDLGVGVNNADGTQVGITSVGNARNPNLPFEGASIIVGAGIGQTTNLADKLAAEQFLTQYMTSPSGQTYLAEIMASRGEQQAGGADLDVTALPDEQKAQLALEVFYLVLRDAGRSATSTGTTAAGATASGPTGYAAGLTAISTLFTNAQGSGSITTRSRDIRSKSGGNIDIFAPGGGLTLATTSIGTPLAPPGILTEDGGNISIFTQGDVDLGVSRIFTLRGGNIIIWSTMGNIAAGSSPKTVQTAPPTRVLIDPQSADVETDLAGLATGGGIGVLATVGGVPPGNVDLIAPSGVVDAGDAGIRATGNLNIAATQVLNADNIQVAGSSTGTPAAAPVSAPNISGFSTASNAGAAATNAAQEAARQTPPAAQPSEEAPSIIVVDVVSFGEE